VCFVLLLVLPVQAQETVLVELGSGVVFLDNRSDPGIGIAWTAKDYTNSWLPGTYGVGYGADTLVQTPVLSGTSSVYTRAEFTISDVSTVQTLFLGADFDDGYIAWINGQEVYRSPQMRDADSLPVPAWNTPALPLHESSNAAPPDYGVLINISSPGIGALENGTNVLAVGVWNGVLPSSDLVVVPQLVMNLPAPEPRGPYLQLGTPSSIMVRWRTSALEDSRVRYGSDPGSLTMTVDDLTPDMDHEVTLTGLDPDTVYYYSVGTTAGAVIAGGDADHFFRTSPPAGTRRPVRVWAVGDSGTANANARAVRDAYKSFTAGIHTDLWLMLGDNAYSSGTDDQYQAAVFETYPQILSQSVVWATLGNHDAVSASTLLLTGPYYESFTLPDGAQAGGISSGTEAYYSFDFANIHFICLNSQELNGPFVTDMMNWLQADLMDTSQDWTIAFWHHPPYSRGSHDSDDPADSGGRLDDMRQNVLPLLEAEGVDLVLSGHSHSYERSFLLGGHYGTSEEIVTDPSLKLDPGDGRITGDGAYEKPTAGPAAHEGAVYVVAGSSGKISGGDLNHPAMFLSLNLLGSVVLDVDGHRMDLTFLDDGALIQDQFTLVKDTGTAPLAGFFASPTLGAVPLSVDFTDQSTTNTASWSWDLDGDASPDSSAQHPGQVYSTPGTYTVSLTATNATGSHQETKAAYICASNGTPALVSGVAADLGSAIYTWDALALADHYDVVKGDLGLLASSGGDFSAAVAACLEEDGTDEEAADAALPGLGEGFFYLVRGQSLCDESGGYDSVGPGQAGSRDAEIQASAQACN